MSIFKPSAGASRSVARDGQQLISLAQKLARDAERHAILSASLASQADRLMLAGLKILQTGSSSKPLAPGPQQVK
jgi:hypothetical protein